MYLLDHLQEWARGKAQIFTSGSFAVAVSEVLGKEKKARYVELEGNNLLARATLWEDGALELEAINEQSETVIQSSRATPTSAQLDDSLNWWLSEISTYVPPAA
ncbi:immunity protein TriTu family protein [Viridibacterium curvum]|uniref:Uncharacterized protein n=1 Tax=Viridibacterium curvum TaxID=1101404 RepID=A0ABP9R7W6_9RHOO